MKRVFILSNNPLFGKCIETLLRQEEGVEIVGHERDPERAVEQIACLKPEVVIVDSNDSAANRAAVMMSVLKQGGQSHVVGLNLNDNSAIIYHGEQKTIGALKDFLETIHSTGAGSTAPPCTDRYGRVLNYLRVSVTDRCNLRCVYCMPPEGVPAKPRNAILRSADIVRIVEAAAGLGFRTVRVTGGEPLVRRGIVDLLRSLATIPGIDQVTMTTNATLLVNYARDLAAAGLARVNISLDSLQPARFRRITRRGNLESVWQGIEAAQADGLTPLKINMVVARGFNDDEVVDFARLTLDHPWHIRFIEAMPIAGLDWGDVSSGFNEHLVTVAEIKQALRQLGPLIQDDGPLGNGPARYYRLPNAQGTIGFISPISEHFCLSCNRLRLTADGYLRSCLFSDQGVYVKPALAAGASLGELQSLIRQAADLKPERRPPLTDMTVTGTAMSMIGG